MSTCPLCETPEAREVFKLFRPKVATATGRPTEELYGRAGVLVRCLGCGLIRQDPRVDAPYQDAEDPGYLVEEEGIRTTFRKTLDRLEKYQSPPGRLLDVGCGPGLLLEEAAQRGWEAVGAELSGWAVEEARSRGLDVRQVVLDELELPEGSVDTATVNDVIEHVPDPLAFTRRLRDLMAPGGVVFMATPDVGSVVARGLRRWWWSVLPGHIFLFSRDTLRRLMSEAGFEVLEVSTHPKTFSLDYYAGRLTGYSSILGRVGRGAVKVFGGPQRLVTPDFRDRVAVLARKP
jgi:SAM-dependent methyltransferase